MLRCRERKPAGKPLAAVFYLPLICSCIFYKRMVYCEKTEEVATLHRESGIRGCYFPWGTTGMHALGEEYFYISHKKTEGQEHSASVSLYRNESKGDVLFLPVE